MMRRRVDLCDERRDGWCSCVESWGKICKAIPNMGMRLTKSNTIIDYVAIRNPVTFDPGAEWEGHQELSMQPPTTFESRVCSTILHANADVYVS